MHLRQFLAILGAALASRQVAAQRTLVTGYSGCDVLVEAGLEDIVAFPTDVAYTNSVSTYYSSENRRMRPFCIAQPRSTKHVSEVIKALNSVNAAGHWDIAVRAGGHTDWDSNAVHRGVTIDLTHLNSVKLSEKCSGKWTGKSKLTKNIASIGPGAVWGNVYKELEQYGLSVSGGRAGTIGVGGLLVSGGASYHMQYWGIGNSGVVKYEVVLGDGSVVEASETENKDLFKSLKGGGNNLGIVTRFDMQTYTVPTDGVYGGLVFGTWDERSQWVDQFVNYIENCEGSHDHQFLLYRNDDTKLGIMAMAVSTDGNKNSSNFAPLDGLTLPLDRRATQPLSQLAAGIADRGGNHYIPWTLTLQPTKEIMNKAAEIFESYSQALERNGVPVSLNFVFQPMPKHVNGKTPDNILGHDQNLPSVSILFEARVTLPKEQAELGGIAAHIMGQAIEELRTFSAARDGHSSYLYMNYAHPSQDVLSSYGEQNVQFLRETAAKYDPQGFFQTRVTGGWKVSRV